MKGASEKKNTAAPARIGFFEGKGRATENEEELFWVKPSQRGASQLNETPGSQCWRSLFDHLSLKGNRKQHIPSFDCWVV